MHFIKCWRINNDREFMPRGFERGWMIVTHNVGSCQETLVQPLLEERNDDAINYIPWVPMATRVVGKKLECIM